MSSFCAALYQLTHGPGFGPLLYKAYVLCIEVNSMDQELDGNKIDFLFALIDNMQ